MTHSRRPRTPALLGLPLLIAVTLSTAPLAGAGGTPLCGGLAATIVGTSGDDDLHGAKSDDVIWGGAGNDRIEAGPGNDLICAGPGNDSVFGGGGRDTLLGGGGDDVIDGGIGDDDAFGGPGDDRLLGGAGDDDLAGADGGDSLSGGPGDDTLSSGPGDDFLEGGLNEDTLAGGADDDSLDGGPGDDDCNGGPGRDDADACEEVTATEAGQVPQPLFQPGPHQVALTFDDGPAGSYTEEILDILARYDVPATFFVVGGKAAAQPALLRRMAAEGHSVQNHTYSHAWLTNYSDIAIADQLARASAVIEDITGTAPGCFRPPFGAVSDRVRRVAAGLGLATIMWDVDPWDFKRPGAAAVASRVLGATGGGDVVLLHDTAGWSTIGALPTIIENLRARGFEFVPLCTIPGVAPRLAGPGRTDEPLEAR